MDDPVGLGHGARVERTVILGSATDLRSTTKPLTAASLIVEINATDGDAGIQPFLDGDPWRRAVVYWPDRRRAASRCGTRGELRQYGLTELFSESSEPPFGEFSLERFKELFPEGEYRFEAIGGGRHAHGWQRDA